MELRTAEKAVEVPSERTDRLFTPGEVVNPEDLPKAQMMRPVRYPHGIKNKIIISRIKVTGQRQRVS